MLFEMEPQSLGSAGSDEGHLGTAPGRVSRGAQHMLRIRFPHECDVSEGHDLVEYTTKRQSC